MDKRTCYDKLWIKNAWKVSSFHFIFRSILFSVTLQLLRRLCAPHPMENLVDIFPFLVICLQARNKCDPVTPSGDICNKRILQSNWSTYNSRTRIYPWDLHSKIDNINFHLSTFPAKINDKIFQNRGKSLICGNNGAYFVVFSQKEFFLKKSSSVQLKWSPSI